jgi:uncharacterized membrane protein SirB2
MASRYSTFGVAGLKDDESATFTPNKRRRLNVVALLLNTLAPWMVFSGVFAALSFSMHYFWAEGAWATVIASFLLCCVTGFFAFRAQMSRQDPMWFTFATVMLFIAALSGTVLGEMNYRYNTRPFFDISNLNTYPSVDPARRKGQQLMDAGRVYFTENSAIDFSKAVFYKNEDRYCVAPIVNTEELADQKETYDFWAVGVNCCGATSIDFKCGAYDNKQAHAGIRLMRDDQRPFFRLAVQQAEAAFNIKADHPLFFEWMQDPVAEMNTYRAAGFKYFLIGICSFFAFNSVAVAFVSFGFAKLGAM